MSKRKGNKSPGKCVFCSGLGMTKEHIWSDWLTQIIPTAPSHTNSKSHIERHSDGVFFRTPADEVRQGPFNQRKIRNVCGSCNGGWMSGVVNRAKPTAELLICDQTTTVSGESLRDLSTWISITTIMAEFTDHEHAAVPETDRWIVRDTLLPPQSWTISVGRYSGLSWSPIKYRHLGRTYMRNRPGAVSEKYQVTTYAMRSLLIQAVSSTDAEVVEACRLRPATNGMVRIWPADSDRVLAWPTDLIIGDDDADMLAEQFFYTALN